MYNRRKLAKIAIKIIDNQPEKPPIGFRVEEKQGEE